MFKLFLKICLVLFLLSWFTTLNASYTQEDLYVSIIELEAIKNWDKIIKVVDNYLLKNKYNQLTLEELDIKLDILWDTIEYKTDGNSIILNVLINYLKIRVYFALDTIYEEANKKEEVLVEEEIVKQIIFPGFSENYNDDKKTILTWEEFYVYAGWVGALHEKADVSGLKFYITWNNILDLKYAIENAYLYVEGVLLKTASYSDIEILTTTKASITFDNIEDFILPSDKQIDFRLAVKSNTIWYEKIWKTMKDLIVSEIDFYDVVWVTSGNSIVRVEISRFSSEEFSISPATLSVEVLKDFNSSYNAELNIKWDFWQNTIDASNKTPVIELDKLKVSVWWSDASTATYSLYNTGNSSDSITWVYNSGVVEFDLSSLWINNKTVWDWSWKKYTIRVSWVTTWIWMDLLKNGITYNIIGISNSNNININLENSINLGYRDF